MLKASCTLFLPGLVNSPMQIEGPHCSIQGGADNNKATKSKGDLGHTAAVLTKGHQAKATVGIPNFYLSTYKCKHTYIYKHKHIGPLFSLLVM